MDYMSSENSSEGEDSDLMPGEWQRLANLARTDSDGRFLPDEKVLEVKTPRWRSMEVSVYRIFLITKLTKPPRTASGCI
jgi:hypothetical protein